MRRKDDGKSEHDDDGDEHGDVEEEEVEGRDSKEGEGEEYISGKSGRNVQILARDAVLKNGLAHPQLRSTQHVQHPYITVQSPVWNAGMVFTSFAERRSH